MPCSAGGYLRTGYVTAVHVGNRWRIPWPSGDADGVSLKEVSRPLGERLSRVEQGVAPPPGGVCRERDGQSRGTLSARLGPAKSPGQLAVERSLYREQLRCRVSGAFLAEEMRHGNCDRVTP